MHVVAHCRQGFENECAQDLARIAAAARTRFTPLPLVPALARGTLEPFDAHRWRKALRIEPPIFARSIFIASEELQFGSDRLTPVIAVARTLAPKFSAPWLETPDTNEGKSLSGLCRRLAPLLEEALVREHLLDPSAPRAPRLHVLFLARERGHVGSSDADVGSPWPMGIPRLRMPHGAPSRSTLKLAEAFATFLGGEEHEALRPGMRAVDLGAAPGGWSWQLAFRGLRVTAVDNGLLRGEVAQDPLVTHVRVDGFGYRPRRPVDWMVCDIVDKPSRIAALVADWIARGDTRRCIFNLKLPMKQRYDHTMRCRDIIADRLVRTNVRYRLALRQLYHDREEVTGWVERTD